MLQVVWFKRDLRVADHAPLARAAGLGPVLPLYVAEPGYWALPDCSGRQWAFVRDSLTELRAELAALGQPLVVRIGDVTELLGRLHAARGIARLWSHEETGNRWTFDRDRAVGAFCRRAGIAWTELPQFGVVRRLRDRDRWAAAFARRMAEPITPPPLRLVGDPDIAIGDIPTAAALGLDSDPCPGRQPGGRRAALGLIESFFAGRGHGYSFEMSSPRTAPESCSRLSAHLAAGAVSMREIVQRARRERDAAARLPPEARPITLHSADAFLARLHWHCHFIQKLESEPSLERRAAHPAFEQRRASTASDDPRLMAWIGGRTGFPFLDACMRALTATGWINFRMRAMLMAFASYHLALDWRVSGLRLARLFTDYEPGIHWPQVQMQSGQTGINTPRIYNPVKQSLDQDREGRFTRHWVPELAALPAPFRHEPWLMSLEQQQGCGIILGQSYPHCIVDHEAAARAARERLTQARGQPGFRAQAEAVYLRHGSRSRPIDRDAPVRSGATRTARPQMKLDL